MLAAFLLLPLLVGQTEHKAMAHMQCRLGPMYAGGFHGWAQLLADGVKFVQKEDVAPVAADRPGVPAGAGRRAAAVPAGAAGDPARARAWSAQPLDVGLFFVLAVVGVGVVGMLMAALGEREQVQPARRAARRRPAAGVRAAVRAGRGVAWRWRPARCR